MKNGLTGQEALTYRRSMPVREAVRYRCGGAFPVCPRCGYAMEREYQGFCDRCGQKLNWRSYAHARIVLK